MASERSKKQRLKDNKGVEDGTVRKGKDGKNIRRWNKSTGRWEKVSVKGAAKKYGSVLKRSGGDDSGTSKQTTYNPGSGTTRSPGDKNGRPGVKPAQYKVVNVKTDPAEAKKAKNRAALSARTSAKSPKKTPIGRIVLRGNPPKKYKWNGERFERYTGSRQPSSGK